MILAAFRTYGRYYEVVEDDHTVAPALSHEAAAGRGSPVPVARPPKAQPARDYGPPPARHHGRLSAGHHGQPFAPHHKRPPAWHPRRPPTRRRVTGRNHRASGPAAIISARQSLTVPGLPISGRPASRHPDRHHRLRRRVTAGAPPDKLAPMMRGDAVAHGSVASRAAGWRAGWP